MKILLIDDDPLHLSSLETSLVVRNYECRSFLNPISAMEAYRNEHFDAIITAVETTEPNGEVVPKSILNINPDAKIIIITSFGNGRIETGKDAGIRAFFRKPIGIDELIRTLENIQSETISKKD